MILFKRLEMHRFKKIQTCWSVNLIFWNLIYTIRQKWRWNLEFRLKIYDKNAKIKFHKSQSVCFRKLKCGEYSKVEIFKRLDNIYCVFYNFLS